MQSGNEQVPQQAEKTAQQGADPQTKQENRKRVQKEIISWIVTLGSAVIIALLIRTFLFEPIRVDGQSMSDTLHDGEIMLVTKPEYLLGDPQRGDVVICKYPGRTENFVKRLMGVPGDTLEIINNVLYLNGEAQEETYLTDSRNDDGFSMAAVTLGEDEYFVMGDNRDNSHDSRNYSRDKNTGALLTQTLTRKQIVGHVQCVAFPFNSIRGIQ